MDTLLKALPFVLLLSACGSMRETTAVRDDVYDIPDRNVMASITDTKDEPASRADEDYYNAEDARTTTRRDYYDLTYNDPYYYNYGRFGFGSSIGSWGPYGGTSLGFGYGWPTSFGSMSIGYGTGFYDPYWGNSWMSGYGYYNPWSRPWGGYAPYDPYNQYGMWGAPYQNAWGSCYGCYQPVQYDDGGNGTFYGHRPSMTGTSGNTSTTTVTPRVAYRNPAGLISEQPTARPSVGRSDIPRNRDAARPQATPRPGTPRYQQRTDDHQRNWDFGGRDSSPSRGGGGDGGGGSRSGGGDGGGGVRSSPRPR